MTGAIIQPDKNLPGIVARALRAGQDVKAARNNG